MWFKRETKLFLEDRAIFLECLTADIIIQKVYFPIN